MDKWILSKFVLIIKIVSIEFMNKTIILLLNLIKPFCY